MYHGCIDSERRNGGAEHKSSILLRLKRSRQAAAGGEGLPGKRGVQRANTALDIFEPSERNKIKILLRSKWDCAIMEAAKG